MSYIWCTTILPFLPSCFEGSGQLEKQTLPPPRQFETAPLTPEVDLPPIKTTLRTSPSPFPNLLLRKGPTRWTKQSDLAFSSLLKESFETAYSMTVIHSHVYQVVYHPAKRHFRCNKEPAGLLLFGGIYYLLGSTMFRSDSADELENLGTFH